MDADQNRSEKQSQQKKEIADLSDGALRVRNGARGSDKFGGPAEKRVAARCGNDSCHGALLRNASGIRLVANLFGDGQRFSSQRGLIAAQIFPVDENDIRRHNLAAGNLDHVAGHKICRIDRVPFPVATHTRT